MATAAKNAQMSLTLPEPYLRVPFDSSLPVKFLAGWKYDAAEVARHGVGGHGAIDFGLEYGAPVFAAADGYAVAAWDERWLTSEDGKPRLLDGKPITFGQGLTVQIYHGKGRYTQYGHLSRLARREAKAFIPFHASTVDDAGNLPPNDVLRAPVASYQSRAVATKVSAGTIIGYVGLTGGAIGVRTYDAWHQHNDGVTLPEDAYPTYMGPHLHFVEFRRSIKSRVAERRDSFGLYDEAGAYPTDTAVWSIQLPGQRHHSLWLPRTS